MDLNVLMRQVQGTHIEDVLLEKRGHRPLADGDLSAEAALGARDWLQTRNLATEHNLAAQYDLTYDGQRLADAMHKSRTRGEGRWELVTRALAEAILARQHPSAITVVDGSEVTDLERELGLSRLEKWNCIKVSHTAQARFVRVEAAQGLFEAPGVEGSLKDHYEGWGQVDQSVTNTTHITGGYVGGVQTGGTGNTLHVAQTLNQLERAGITAKLDAILHMLDNSDAVRDLTEAVEGIREVVLLPEANKSTIKDKVVAGIEVAGNLASVAQAAPLVVQVLPLLAQLVGMLG